MSRVAYVNGRYVRHHEAAVSIEDRGFQFGDGVYEVWAVFGGRLADPTGHFERLARSLSELSIPPPMSQAALTLVLKETVRRNRIREGLAYLQITRGVARRDHAFPRPPVAPTLVVSASGVDVLARTARAEAGVSVVTIPENRWGRCDIKTVNLLPNVLAREAARGAGAAEAWFVDEMGLVTEGAASNAWIVDAKGSLRTRGIQSNILRGVTRRTILDIAEDSGLEVDERPFTVAEAREAREAFITGAGALLTPVVAVDGSPIGGGVPGPVAKRLRHLYIDEARRKAC
jgi:D-alanine transaminase